MVVCEDVELNGSVSGFILRQPCLTQILDRDWMMKRVRVLFAV